MYKDERDIYYYDAVSRVWSRKFGEILQPFPHYELAKVIKKAVDDETAVNVKKGTKQATYITALRLFPDRCEMLIGFSDPVAADPTFNDHPAKKRRVVQKQGDEGLEHSAHVVWYFKDKTNSGRCGFYLEGATGLSSTAVVRFLNFLLRWHASVDKDYFSVPDPEGTVDAKGVFKRIPVRPRIELQGHPSAEFIKDLQQGILTEVELYTEVQQSKPWDDHAYAIEEKRSVTIRPNPAKHAPKAKPLLDGIFKKSVKIEYEFARVAFKTAGNVSRNVRMFSENYNLIHDDTYVKKDRLKDLGGNLPNAFDKFHPEIIRRMRLIAGIT